MRVKKMQIKIQSFEEGMDEATKVIQDLEAGKKVKPRHILAFESLDVMRKFLTLQRQILLRVIRRKKPQSVYELAKIVGRDRKAVTEDLKVLEEMGLVTFETTVYNGRARSKPVSTYDIVRLEFIL